MNKRSLLLLSALFLLACDGSVGNSTTNGPADANTDANVIDSAAPSMGEAAEVIESVSLMSLIQGEITLHNDAVTTGDVNIRVRNTDVSAVMQANGKFALQLPRMDTEQTIVLDISGANVVPDSVSVPVPANTVRVMVSADIARRSTPIRFNLNSGGEMTNPLSPTRVSVSVPANAFEFSDGTLAVGAAQVNITEINLEELNGESAWAPNLLGIAEGMSEESAIMSLGMSDFHFSQNGRDLQLRPGKTATIKTDMVNTVLIPKGGDCCC